MNVCAWCQQPNAASRTAPAASHAPVSHGICPSCLAVQMSKLDVIRPAVALR
jgi:hypothetical protein